MQTQLIIDNLSRDAQGGRTFQRLNPLTGDLVTEGAAASVEDALDAVESAAKAFASWAATGPSTRRAVMLKAADIMERRTPEFIETMMSEVGAAQLWAGFNAFLTAQLFREAAGLATQIQGETLPTDKPGTLSMTVRQPAGVVLSMAPWNGAGVLAARAIAYPLVCGNTVVFRASETSPRTHAIITEILHEAGLPAGVLNFLTSTAEDSDRVVEAIIAHPAVRRVNFTGSTVVGRVIAEKAARHLKPALLELGGKAPFVVLDDADIDGAVNAAVFGSFLYQGQICMSTERFVVDEAVADEFVAKFAARAQSVPAGDPLADAGCVVGPMVRPQSGHRINSLIDDAVSKGGSAGCTLVGTLAKREPSAQILLIEAGAWDTAPSIGDPRLWFTNLGTVRDWNDVSIPTPSTNNHPIPEHTARVIGGGSSINATIWARPFRADLDHWAAETGDPRWGYQHGLQLFKSIEDWRGTPDPAFRGEGGPVWVQPAADPLPMATACLGAFRELGLPVLDDLNGEREITGNGFAYMNQIIKNGRRHSMARAFLYPVLARENVTVLVNTQVNRVILEQGRAVGVECARNGKNQTFRAHREIILSTGGFNTPKLLMLSGIGPKAELRALNIPVHVDSPNVGENVQDHVLHGGCLYEAPKPFVYTNSAANVSGYYKTDPSFERPDVSIVEIELPYASPVIAEEFPPPPNTWALCGGLVTPQSRGTVKLRSANPADRPIVDMRFLSHPDDVVKLERSIKIAREAAATAALKPFVVREVAPGRTLQGKELVNFVRNGTTTYFHSSGACRMGKDEAAVVDPQLRVNGVRNLRIADSTIMPRIVAVPTMPACVFIGLRLAEMLCQGASTT